MSSGENALKIIAILATQGDRSWLVAHAYAGPAIFMLADSTFAHLEATRATGIEYRVIELLATDIKQVSG